MFENVTPEKAMVFTRLSVALSCAWPISADATRVQRLRCYTFRVVGFISALLLFLPSSYAMYLYYSDTVVLVNAAAAMIATTHIMLQIFIFGVMDNRFRLLIEDLTAFCRNMKAYERRVLQEYLDKFSKFYGLTVTWFYMCAVVMILGPLIQPTQKFPAVTEYPFSVDYMPMKAIVFLHQSLVAFQCSSAVSGNMFGAMLLLYSSAKLDILTIDLKAATTIKELTACLKKYHTVTRFTWQVVSDVQYIGFGTIIVNSVIIAFCGFNLIGKQPIVVYMESIFVVGTSLLEVLMWALPADHLTEISEKVIRGAYESAWYEQGLGMQKEVLRVMMPQRPIVMSLKCFVPVLNLDYFCSYISSAFSLITALRAALDDEEDTVQSESTNSTYASH